MMYFFGVVFILIGTLVAGMVWLYKQLKRQESCTCNRCGTTNEHKSYCDNCIARCSVCEKQIDTDFVEMDFVNGKEYCQDCEIPFKDRLLDWIDKNSFTDFGNRDKPDSEDLECVYVDEIVRFIKESE